MLSALAYIGQRVRQTLRQWSHTTAMLLAVLRVSLQPRYWPPTSRNVLVRQILFTGVEAVRFTLLIAFICGMSLVVQAQVWLTRFGQSKMVGPILVIIVVRELAPLLTALIVLGRSGAAIAAELSSMRVTKQVHLLDTQGIDPFTYLVMPRVIGVAISVTCLTILFIGVCLVSGFITSAMLLGASAGGPMAFAMSVAQALKPIDLFVILAKTFIPGLLIGIICCDEGLAVQRDITEIPRATTQGQIKSLVAILVTFLLVSLLIYA